MTDSSSDEFAAARTALIAALRQHVSDERVLDAFLKVPRERFISPSLRRRAYENVPLPIGHRQTISQPLVVAVILEALRLEGREHVLDVGTGSGYQAALLAELAATVVTVERIPSLGERSAVLLQELGYANVTAHNAGPLLGWPEEAPYDAIAVAAAAPRVPEALVAQLAPGGRLVLPVGGRGRPQELIVVEKTAAGIQIASRGPCAFVPLIGAGAFPS